MLRRKKEQTAVEKMNEAHARADWAVGLFEDAHDELEHANSLLRESVEHHEGQLQTLTNHIETAKTHIEKNERVRAKLSEFIS